MNERIRELWEESQQWNKSDDGRGGLKIVESVEKFAELIVWECLSQVNEQYIPVLEDKEMMTDSHWVGYVHCGVDSVVGIREHFGVSDKPDPDVAKPWVGLTDEDVAQLAATHLFQNVWPHATFAAIRAIEAKLKEKNT